MNWAQLIFGTLLVAGLLFLSLFYAWRQVRALHALGRTRILPEEETRYERRKAWRRLVSSALTLVLAALLAGVLVYLEGPAQRLANEREGLTAEQAPAFTQDERSFLRWWGGAWVALLLVLMVVVLLAAFDLWATHRYASRERRKLQADRRAMIERQVNRMRVERNGQE